MPPNARTIAIDLQPGLAFELSARAGGERIDWVAGQAEGSGRSRVWALVLGPAGLQIASPGPAERTWTYSGWSFQPESLTSVAQTIVVDATEPPEADQADSDDEPEPLLAASLPENFRLILGCLPAQVQVHLQEPFRPGPGITAFQANLGDINMVDFPWRFWCYLTDNATLTFASGTRQPIPHASQHADARQTWDVRCYRALVA
jgi:hypothetical protein